ncbi:hypothetical protein Lbru_2897 [Legionella brunensis]|uniref:Uncharacterized protein n=1 Tax=Legionella brunensis TaxID=29422 RepID=A0A0W0S0D3_9GAMM|nr:hypothetical protein Lbru_2897 [Legionella brunensis]
MRTSLIRYFMLHDLCKRWVNLTADLFFNIKINECSIFTWFQDAGILREKCSSQQMMAIGYLLDVSNYCVPSG